MPYLLQSESKGAGQPAPFIHRPFISGVRSESVSRKACVRGEPVPSVYFTAFSLARITLDRFCCYRQGCHLLLA